MKTLICCGNIDIAIYKLVLFCQMKKNQTLNLFKDNIPKYFGGNFLKGNAKRARPLSSKHAIHVVLKSEMATGPRSFLAGRNVRKVDAIIRSRASKVGVRIYHAVNVGNHIHLIIRPQYRNENSLSEHRPRRRLERDIAAKPSYSHRLEVIGIQCPVQNTAKANFRLYTALKDLSSPDFNRPGNGDLLSMPGANL